MTKNHTESNKCCNECEAEKRGAIGQFVHRCGLQRPAAGGSPNSHDLKDLLEEAKLLLNDKRTGLKESSDSNKSRYAILALIETAFNKGIEVGENKGFLEAIEKALEKFPEDKRERGTILVYSARDVRAALTQLKDK